MRLSVGYIFAEQISVDKFNKKFRNLFWSHGFNRSKNISIVPAMAVMIERKLKISCIACLLRKIP